MKTYKHDATLPVMDARKPFKGILEGLEQQDFDQIKHMIPEELKKDEKKLRSARKAEDWAECIYRISRFDQMQFLLEAPRLKRISHELNSRCQDPRKGARWDLIDPLIPILLEESKRVREAVPEAVR